MLHRQGVFMTDEFEAYCRAIEARFAAAIERVKLLIAKTLEIQQFEEACRKAARSRVDASKAVSLKQEMEKFDALGAALGEALDRQVAEVRRLALLPGELNPGQYLAAMQEILDRPERTPEAEVQLYLAHRAKEARWIVPVMMEGVARAVISLDDFMTRHIELHCDLFNVPVPGNLTSLLTKVAAEYRHDPMALLKPMELPELVQRTLNLISRYQAPERAFSAKAMDEMNRIFGFIDAAQPLLDAQDAVIADIAESATIQTDMTNDLIELSRDVVVAYRNP